MKNLLSIAQIRKRLRESGWGVYSPKSIYDILTKHGIKKRYKEYYHSSTLDFIQRHIQELKERENELKNTKIPSRQSEDDIPLPTGYYQGMSRASQELLDKDDIDYAKYNYFHKNNENLYTVYNQYKDVINENLFYNKRNSDGQEVPETGEYSTNVYLKDCPFMIGKEQVEFFKKMQDAKEKHTIKDVDEFIESSKKKDNIE